MSTHNTHNILVQFH